MFHFIPSSFVYFISGIFVAVGVNLITTNPAIIMYGAGDIAFIVCSMPWLACSVFLAILAINLESAENEYASNTLNSLGVKECEELKKSIYKKYSIKLRIWALLVLVSFGVGIYFSIDNPVIPQVKENIPEDTSSPQK